MLKEHGDRVKAELTNSAQEATWCKAGSHKWNTITLRVLNLLDVEDFPINNGDNHTCRLSLSYDHYRWR
jgi:hypothetical protein